jgi:radical SAM enzyme (TIGR01210 family)
LDPLRPHGFFLEKELTGSGRVCSSAVILLTNKECPWRCLMCDLWKNTIPFTVAAGAIPGQIEYALGNLGTSPDQIKLYNSGSFFDPASIPVTDYSRIAETISFAERVIVECHPRLIGKRVTSFKNLLDRKQRIVLEVALGLETIHPVVLPLLNKGFTLEDFSSSVRFLRERDIAWRAFVLVNPPFLAEKESLEWTIKSAEYAFSCGATVVSLIPTRSGNGAMDRLAESGEFVPPRVASLEKAFEECLRFFSRKVIVGTRSERMTVETVEKSIKGAGSTMARVFADTWNLERFSKCHQCLQDRQSRLIQMNLTQQILPPIDCPACGGL